jgi:hypothetical protein
MQIGSVEGIYLAGQRGASLHAVEAVVAIAGRGLEGDRYFSGEGTFYQERKIGQDVTLIEAEAIEGLASEEAIELSPGQARRNVVTRGVALNDLLGRRFSLGEAVCVGRRLCDPCQYLEQLTKPGVLKGLANRGGLRADVVKTGSIEVGSEVRELPE